MSPSSRATTSTSVATSASTEQRTPIWVFLVNGIKLTGVITSFDQYVLAVESNSVTQMVLKHAVSTVIEQHALGARSTDTRKPPRGDSQHASSR
ncbi:RNA chaperone Hfq [Caballeronia arvi]|uniref:RNA chaperone Hfq n=1 Tax=Caballeronia arvi TaxID=1777135 RepID=UPI000B350580|nr:RNA chaperone Hfq [Caballeronia arvi]